MSGKYWRIKNTSGVPVLLDNICVFVTSHFGTGLPDPANTVIPFGIADGGRFQRTVYPVRTFVLNCTINAENLYDYHYHKQELIDLLRRDRTVTTQAVTVQYSYLGKVLEIDAYLAGGLSNESEPVTFSESFPLRFVAPDPLWRSTKSVIYTLNVNALTAVDNEGKADTYPIITLAGEGNIVSIANGTTGQTITFTGLDVIAGEIITIDLRPAVKTITSDVRGNLFLTIDQGSPWSSWKLIEGNNNVTLTASANGILQDELLNALQDEASLPLQSTSVLNLTTATLQFTPRYWSVDGVI